MTNNRLNRILALEKIIADRTPISPVQFVILHCEADDPVMYAQQKQRIKDIKAKGEKVIVYSVVDASVEHGNA
jgi:hypothetical protein